MRQSLSASAAVNYARDMRIEQKHVAVVLIGCVAWQHLRGARRNAEKCYGANRPAGERALAREASMLVCPYGEKWHEAKMSPVNAETAL